MPKKINFDEEKVIDMYLNEKKSSYEIAKEFNCWGSTILKILNKNNINLFKPGFFIKGKPGKNKKQLNKNEIVRLYLDEKKSSYEIGTIFNCSDVTILNNLKRLGVRIRSGSESLLGRKHKIGYTPKQIKARSERVKQDYINHPELREIRSKQFKENARKAKEDGTLDEIIKKRIKSFKESLASGKCKSWNKDKTHLDDKRILSGDKIHTFNNWSSKEPYDKRWTEAFRRLIRKRDNQVCMNCLIHREKLKRALDIHHINSNKSMSLKENCVSLCPKCHALTKFNKKHWTKFFQSLLSEKYNYKYSESGEIIFDIKIENNLNS